ncbi:MAG TPA: site-2 protease family protein [Chthonomonadaceae bacterium]|nr:site-2 protease family protein [Chthonomonadaceae bacterium]
MPTEIPTRETPPLPEGPIEGSPRPPEPHTHADWSALRILTVAGIPIRLHFTFLILLVWVAVSNVSQGQVAVWASLLMVIGTFACVVLHELGHALVAQRFGIGTRDIVLYPIGGIASLTGQPRPRQEIWIALAGPAVNVLIAALLFVGLQVAGLPILGIPINGIKPGASAAQFVLTNLLWINVALAVFNMIPAFPMDGGRVLRAMLALFLDETQATVIAARIGQFLAALFGLFALFNQQLLLIFIAGLVYFAAGQEAARYQTQALVRGHKAREAMMREFHTLPSGTTLKEAAETLIAGSQHDFPIMNGDEVIGILSRSALIRGFTTEDTDNYVTSFMERDFTWVRPEADLQSVLPQISTDLPILVMEPDAQDNPRLIGMLTQENLIEFLMLTQRPSQNAG